MAHRPMKGQLRVHFTWKNTLRAAALGTLVAMSGATALGGMTTPALAAPGPAPTAGAESSCSDDKLYGIVAYPQMESASSQIIAPSQVVEYSRGSDGQKIESSREISTEFDGVSSTDWVPSSDGLGVSTDCTFYFVQNSDFASVTPAVDLYRFSPAEGDAPQLVQRNFSMNSPTAANVNAGAVAPDGSYYFAYTSRQTPSDQSDATTEALRLHLYRYAHTPGRDPESRDQPNALTGEVAHIDIEVDTTQFAGVPTVNLHGDLTFDRAGNLVYFVSNEGSNERLSAVIPASQFADLPGLWKREPTDPTLQAPIIALAPTGFVDADPSPLYMGVAYTPEGDLALLSLALNSSQQRYDASFSVIAPDTLQPVPGTTSQLEMPAKIRAGYEPFGGGMYPLDLASAQFAGTLGARLTVDELAAAGDRFTLTVADAAGTTLATAEGDLSVAADPVLTRAGEYTVTQTSTGNLARYTTSWACRDSAHTTLASGRGSTATVTVASNQAVSCDFRSVAKQLEPATPTISGTPVVGATLTAVPGTWKPSGIAFTYQWLRNGEPITGATRETYVAAQEDLGAEVSVEVTGSLEHYPAATRESAPVAPTAQPDPNTDGSGTDGKPTDSSGTDGRPSDGTSTDAPADPGQQRPGTPDAGTRPSDLATTGAESASIWIALLALTLGAAAVLTARARRVKR